MNMRNLLKPGDYVIPIPAGLPIELEYGPSGVLQSVKRNDTCKNREAIGHKVLSQEFKASIVSEKLVPNKIPVKDGTTFVWCIVVPTSIQDPPSGALLESFGDSIIKDIESHKTSNYKCYAYYAQSFAILLRGAHPILQWLSMVKFNTLKGYVLTVSMPTDNTSVQMIDRKLVGDICPSLSVPMMFGSYRGLEFSQYSTGIRHIIVKSVDAEYDASGTLWATVVDTYDFKLWVDYSYVIRNPIYPKDILVLDNLSEVIHKYPTTKSVKYTWENRCPVCGGPIQRSGTGRTTCTNNSCFSKLYPKCTHFLKTLHLPGITHDRFIHEFGPTPGAVVSDLFTLPELSELCVRTTLPVLIKACVGELSADQYRAVSSFVYRCNNVIKSVCYYLDNPDLLRSRVDMYSPQLEPIITWFEDTSNMMTFRALLDTPQIQIDTILRKFEGAPIFRGCKILLTGEFIHGTEEDVESILNSYDATIVHEMSDEVSFILVGSTLSNINGRWIQEATRANKPVYYEIEFFKAHEIDDDLNANLL